MHFFNYIDDIEEICENKNWLKVHNAPWEIIEQKWKETFDVRSRELDKTKDTASIIGEWPLYRNSKGYRLVSTTNVILKL